MRIKTQLTLGVGALFLLIAVLALVAIVYINALSNDTQRILVANYNSLEYVHGMLNALDDDGDPRASGAVFTKYLKAQRANITEMGEGELTDELARHYTDLPGNAQDTVLRAEIRKDLYAIMDLNMSAIARKSQVAQGTAEQARTWITIAGVLCFLIAFTLLVNFPRRLSEPIRQLSEGIQRIAARRYDERIHVEGGSEFSEVAERFNTMAARLEEWENSNVARLIFEKQRIETIINAMYDPIIVLDEERRVLFANAGACAVLGLAPEALVGRPAQEVALHNDLLRTLTRDVLRGEEERGHAPMKIFADGKESYFEEDIITVNSAATAEERAKFLGHVIVLKNVTPLKELDLAKTNFIATVSHELKTPISSILMSVDLVRDERVGPVNDEQRELLRTIEDDSRRLLGITTELLKMTQVETGKVQLAMQATEPASIVRYALDANKSAADGKHITIALDVGDQLPAVNADSEKAAWTLTNLLSNAIRYSGEGSPVRVTVARAGEAVEFAVTDQGPGIDVRYADRIFDRYFRIPGGNKEGTGLGLAIGKEFIEAMGGRIGLTSAVGQGSRFWFTLPLIP